MIRLTTLALSAALAVALGAPAYSQSFAGQQAGSAGGYAIVTLSGKLAHGQNVRKFSHTGAGAYAVRFSNDISKCSAVAAIARRGKDALLPGFIVVGARRGQKETVTVNTFATLTLLPADYPFNLTVTC